MEVPILAVLRRFPGFNESLLYQEATKTVGNQNKWAIWAICKHFRISIVWSQFPEPNLHSSSKQGFEARETLRRLIPLTRFTHLSDAAGNRNKVFATTLEGHALLLCTVKPAYNEIETGIRQNIHTWSNLGVHKVQSIQHVALSIAPTQIGKQL